MTKRCPYTVDLETGTTDPAKPRQHPSIGHLLRLFQCGQLEDQGINGLFQELSQAIASMPPSPEVSVALRKLMEARSAVWRVEYLTNHAE